MGSFVGPQVPFPTDVNSPGMRTRARQRYGARREPKRRRKEAADAWHLRICRTGDAYFTPEVVQNWVRQITAVNASLPAMQRRFAPLKSLDLEGVAELIRNGHAKNIVIITGAGISTWIPGMSIPTIPTLLSSGIVHFFTILRMIWLNPLNILGIFEINNFLKNPHQLYRVVKDFIGGVIKNNIKATPTHQFIRLLIEKNLLLKNITTNFDSLEIIARIEEEYLVRMGGTFLNSHCIRCNALYDIFWLKEELIIKQIDVPLCSACGGLVKPDVYLFGEEVSSAYLPQMRSLLRRCDLLIVMGFSMTMMPHSSLIGLVDDACPRLLVDFHKRGVMEPWQRSLGLPSMEFDAAGNTRDVFWQGDCDAAVTELARLIGWEKDLESLVEENVNDPNLDAAMDIYSPDTLLL